MLLPSTGHNFSGRNILYRYFSVIFEIKFYDSDNLITNHDNVVLNDSKNLSPYQRLIEQ
jgi:hypothetical protein